MPKSLNINVLVAAKEEYTKQLVFILTPEIYVIHSIIIYNESQLIKKKRRYITSKFSNCFEEEFLFGILLLIEKYTSLILKTKYHI